MPLVDIYLSGRKYSVSCEAGQEMRLRELAENVNGRLRELAENGLTGSDAHMLALTSLLLADELADTAAELARVETRGSVGTPGVPHMLGVKEALSRDAAANTIDAVTRRIEDLAIRLERS